MLNSDTNVTSSTLPLQEGGTMTIANPHGESRPNYDWHIPCGHLMIVMEQIRAYTITTLGIHQNKLIVALHSADYSSVGGETTERGFFVPYARVASRHKKGALTSWDANLAKT